MLGRQPGEKQMKHASSTAWLSDLLHTTEESAFSWKGIENKTESERDSVFSGDSIWRTKVREMDEGMMWLVRAGPILRMMSRCQVLRECERERKG